MCYIIGSVTFNNFLHIHLDLNIFLKAHPVSHEEPENETYQSCYYMQKGNLYIYSLIAKLKYRK